MYFSELSTRTALATAAAALALAVSTPLAAQSSYPSLEDPPDLQRGGTGDVAVIVAIEDYAFLPNVPGAVTNANAWENHFRRGLGLDDEDVRLLVDRQATRERIATFTERAARDVADGGQLWFVFIGHGAPTKESGSGILVGMDARGTPSSLRNRGISQDELLGGIQSGNQSETVMVVDACFSGRGHGGEALAEGTQPVVPTQKPKTGANTTVLTAARSSEFAGQLPGADRPAFSYLLLGAIQGWADDGDGTVTASEALSWTQQQLRLVSNRQQTPELFGSTDPVLARDVRAEAPELARLLSRPSHKTEEREPSEPDDASPADQTERESCEPGKVRNSDTLGHCCWPGQSWNGEECVGKPTSCPDQHVARGATCKLQPCEEGRVRTPDDIHCCWPEQAWSSSRDACVGEPKCPDDAIRDENTCLLDRDADGIPDEEDDCPDEKEDKDGVQDDDGCPEDDADNDGIPDAEDECPLEPEDSDGFRDDDGCPEERDGKIAGAIGIGASGVGLGLAGTGFFVAGTAMRNSLRSSLDSNEITRVDGDASRNVVDSETTTQQEAFDRLRRARDYRALGGVTATLGGTALAAGVIWAVVDPDPLFAPSASIRVAPERRAARVGVSIDF